MATEPQHSIPSIVLFLKGHFVVKLSCWPGTTRDNVAIHRQDASLRYRLGYFCSPAFFFSESTILFCLK